jgi:hypothetical protein
MPVRGGTPPSSALMENARSRHALTHRSRQPTFVTDESGS